MNEIKNDKSSMKIKRVTLVEAVVEQMMDAIKSGRFKPGEKIPSEKALINEFGVSRTTLREAFKTLEYAGTISIKQGNGTYLIDNELNNSLPVNNESFTPTIITDSEKTLAPKSKTLYSETTKQFFSIGTHSLSSYIEARELVELAAIKNLIEKESSQDIEQLNRILEQQQIDDDYSTFALTDFNFHKTLVFLSGNEFLYDFWMCMVPFIREQIDSVSTIPGMIESARNTHKKLLKYISNGDTKKALAVGSEHFRVLPGRLITKGIMNDSFNDTKETNNSN